MAFTTKSSRKQEDLLGSLTAIQSLPDLNQFTYEFQNMVWMAGHKIIQRHRFCSPTNYGTELHFE